ncbi:DUF3606 domain-containing protein [Roseicella frigidaeris]|uniref:DUF3606 domain-containing protein n=1 Tax=Roseicella frigidaeris TaxID=2230885 RepID=A0A327M3K5_9PROT|nr:DUF3606 domain-containing protein [Roseicella frigidaeris]RAI54648.1 DUF3606 domain-containing protein [Roseicella frigidaeris]
MSGRSPGDDPKIRGPRDNTRISLSEPYEVQAWCQKLGVTERQLRDAVAAVGPLAANVARHLGKRL